jgi:DNA-binding HxlR family transcriptional regulator
MQASATTSEPETAERPAGESGTAERPAGAPATAATAASQCCPLLHEAVELVGKRWTGAILYVLMQGGRLRFTQIAQAVPDLSDRLLSERMKELEKKGIVVRHVSTETPVKVCYELTDKGRELQPALGELKTWADRWLSTP